jgi:Tfp pilus assembly protein PilN
MQSINFIPVHRMDARRQRAKVTRWTAVVGVYASVLLAAYAVLYGFWGGEHETLAQEQEKADAKIRDSNKAIKAVHAELAEREMTLKANQDLADQPDWGLLLVVLARSLNDGVVLSRCELKPDSLGAPAAAAPAATSTAAAAPLTLRLVGRGQTMEAVLKFAQAMERTGIFDQVHLARTGWEPFHAGTAVTFQVECTSGGKAGVSR